MKRLVSLVAVFAIVAGVAAVLSPVSADRKRVCAVRCPVCYQAVDLTPQNKNDCKYVCQPVPGCVEGT